MPGLDFRKRFASPVKDGRKKQTIQKRRTPPIKAGDHLTLWTGQRTKQCQPLGDATCTKVLPIKILPDRGQIWLWDEDTEHLDSEGEIVGNFYMLRQDEAEAFAKADGFDNLQEFFEFFKHYPNDVLHFQLVAVFWDFKK